MKKQILTITLLLTTIVSALAFNGGNNTIKSKTLTPEQTYTSITAKGNVEVILVSSQSTVISLEGDEKFVEKVRVRVSKGVLHIAGVNGRSKDRVTVYVPVNDLGLVTLRNGSNLSSKGRLINRLLRVRVEGVSVVNLKSAGEIIIDSDDNHLFNYEKQEHYKVIVEKA
ncbi:MAG: DUF2807 domain-containing protein [Flavitalea sp.]